MTEHETEKAILLLFDGTLGAEEQAHLRQELKTNEEARHLYYTYARMHQKLDVHFSGAKSVALRETIAAASIREQKIKTVWIASVSAIAACLVIALVLGAVWLPGPPLTLGASTASQYSIKHLGGKRGGLADADIGSTVKLTQGSLALTFRSGSQAVFLAPSHFTILSSMKVDMVYGTAWFQIKPRDSGFQVQTPELLITDLGTEFGVLLDESQAGEVHVIDGSVLAKNRFSDEEVRLNLNEARRLGPSGELEEISCQPDHFLRALPSTDSGELIANGDFESGNQPRDTAYGIPATASLLPSWNFSSHRVRVAYRNDTGKIGYGPDVARVTSPSRDTQIAFQGSLADPSLTRIWQSFETEAGEVYEVRFEMGALSFSGNYGVAVTASVYDGFTIEGESGLLATHREVREKPEPPNAYNAGAIFEFVAQSHLSTLVFEETSQRTDTWDPLLDNVSVRKKNEK